MKQILVDTDVLIDYAHGLSAHLGKLLEAESRGAVQLWISPVNVAEFCTDKKLTSAKMKAKAEEFLLLFSIKETTKAMGILAGELLRKGKTVYLGDALIAATSLAGNIPLYTRNIRHFEKISGLEFFKN